MNSTHTTAINGLNRPDKEPNEEQLRRIVHSEIFRHAPALQRLLQYIGSKAIEEPLTEIKEYTIGTEVFDRGSDYDPKIDTIVRVQIHRLRLKLKEYYEAEGGNDSIVVEVPKGHYLPSFEYRAAVDAESDTAPKTSEPIAEATLPGETDPAIHSHEIEGQSPRANRSSVWWLSAVIASGAILLFAAGLVIGTRLEKLGITGRSGEFPVLAGSFAGTTGDTAQNFWASFLGSDKAPVVGYANAVFLADRSSDLFRFRKGASDNRGTPVDPHLAQQFASNPALVEKAGPLYYEDGYTGTGDVESISAFTRLFTQMGLQIVVKRCRLVTIDDLREHNVILLGSPDQNDAVAQLPQIADFVFQAGNPPGAWGGHYLNERPQPGEQVDYRAERDPATQELKTNYGLITIQPGVVPGRYIAILSALDTSGVAGTAQFMTSPSQMAELTNRLEALGEKMGSGQPAAFQALLRVDVEKGNDVLDVHLLAVHAIHPAGEGQSATGTADSTQAAH